MQLISVKSRYYGCVKPTIMVEWLALRILKAPGSNLRPETAVQAFGGFVQFLQSNGGMVSCKIRNDHFLPHPS